uniref:Silicatein beta n=1 Tax=Tethya aurantium TaxID=281732 RepID=Q9U554_TETAR|nr:silicatein beta [Tethya aurantium]
MKWIVAVCMVGFLVAVTSAGRHQPVFEHHEEWQLWKSQHGKSYRSGLQELERHLVWVSNKEYIDRHNANADVFGFSLAMNHFGDLSDNEFVDKYLSYTKSDKKKRNVKMFEAPEGVSYPESLDWRTKGAVTSVKNQGDCGASYAFSAIGSLEGALSLAQGKLTYLSEQNVIDCSVAYGNHGCQGGNMYNTYLYILSNDGIDTSDGYPFKGKQTSCTYDRSCRGTSISGSIAITSGSESDLQAAVASAGPVAVAVDGSSRAFRFYDYGLYNLPGCSSYQLSHALLITGYGSFNGNQYWLVKNSWGTNWGMSGYIMMTRNNYNQCGIATDAAYPTL